MATRLSDVAARAGVSVKTVSNVINDYPHITSQTRAKVEAPRPLGDRADAVLPAVAGHEVAARVADRGDAQLADQREHVLAEPVRIGGGMPRLVDAGVDAASHVLDERAEQAPVERSDHERGINRQTSHKVLQDDLYND